MFLGKIKDAFARNPELENLLLDDFFRSAVESCQVRSPERGGGDSVSGGFALGASFSFTSIDVYENLSFRMEPVIFSVG